MSSNNDVLNTISSFAIPLATFTFEVIGYLLHGIITYCIDKDNHRNIYFFTVIGLIIAFICSLGLAIPVAIVFFLQDTTKVTKAANIIVLVVQSGYNLGATIANARNVYSENIRRRDNQVVDVTREQVELINEANIVTE